VRAKIAIKQKQKPTIAVLHKDISEQERTIAAGQLTSKEHDESIARLTANAKEEIAKLRSSCAVDQKTIASQQHTFSSLAQKISSRVCLLG
jgi:hypothetical protein